MRTRTPRDVRRSGTGTPAVSMPRSRRKSETMTTQYVSRYEVRVDLVRKTVQEHSNLDDKTAAEVAVHVVHALDHLPELTR